MDKLLDLIVESTKSVESIGVIISTIATLLAFLTSAFLRAAPSRKEHHVSAKASTDPKENSRFAEISEELARQKRLARWNASAAASLTFGQYIVGGLLASSFVQQSLSQNMIGFLGVLVLVSSLVHQRFRPDLLASGARTRVQMARNLSREIEDDLFALENKHPDAPSIFLIRKKATTGLSNIEASELAEKETISTAISAEKKK